MSETATQTGTKPTLTKAGPLEGVVVVDLSRVLAGPYCTMVLADLGARVIKIETPERGDDSRYFGPFAGDKSAYYMSLNCGKESIALDLKDSRDRETFEALLEQADVLVENFRPGAMDRLGYAWEVLHQRYPRLIYAGVSGFGRTGPYAKRPAYDMVVQAMGGIMSLTGFPDGPPTRVGTSVGDITAGLFAAVGINAALYDRERTGTGVLVDVAMLDCQVAILENAIARFAATGEVPHALGARHPSITPFDAFAAEDGFMIVAAGNDALFTKLCEVVGRPDLGANPLFASNTQRTEHHAALKVELEVQFARRPIAEWLQVLEDAGIPCGPINTVDKVLADPQVRARNMVVTVDDPTAGTLQMAGSPIKMPAFPAPSTRRPAPDLDQDRKRILDDLARRRR